MTEAHRESTKQDKANQKKDNDREAMVRNIAHLSTVSMTLHNAVIKAKNLFTAKEILSLECETPQGLGEDGPNFVGLACNSCPHCRIKQMWAILGGALMDLEQRGK